MANNTIHRPFGSFACSPATHRFEAQLVGQRVDLLAHKLHIVERQTELLSEVEGPGGTGVATGLEVPVHLGHVEGGTSGDVVQNLTVAEEGDVKA